MYSDNTTKELTIGLYREPADKIAIMNKLVKDETDKGVMTNMLTLEHLVWTAPGGQRILDGVDLVIPDSKLVVITGPNGGGKTTLAKMIAGLEKPDSGRIFLDDTDITDLDITERANLGISYAFQQPVRFKGLTVRDLMELAAKRKFTDKELCDVLSKVGLCAQEYIDREVNASLSGGEIKRIEIATVMERHTKATVFDEPEAGIDLWSFQNLIGVFQDIRKSLSGSLIIISHQERILSIADEIVVLADGKIKAKGSRYDLLPSLLEETSSCPRQFDRK